ncbi:T6SS immunity protein Tdi1 domain-containing protein [Agromyces sp. Marseille-Q5079]|uniref:T6SS immunity protein Tdi1 domain-containing protein n=1 Tax=Agromyces sp. Marseille-Q5079 TaxID=3439059 RepID=UPI003D9C996D
MTSFRTFDPVAPISDETIERYRAQVPPEVAELWRSQGAGFVGTDGFFRVVDPARAAEMLADVLSVPDGATVLFTTALADVIAYANGLYLVFKPRFGALDVIQDTSFDELVAHLEDPAQRDEAWEWEPYPAARDREGIPGIEECYGFVPLLAIGGRADAEHLQRGGLYEHLAVIAQLAGQPEVRRVIEFAPAAPSDAAADQDRLVSVGLALFAKLTDATNLTVIHLPDGLGVCIVHAVRGGGKIYVAPDESALFVGSSVDYEAGLGAFRDGVRTPLEKFDIDRGGNR